AVSDPTASVDERSTLLGALLELPPRQRAAVVLRYWEDLTDAQAGALLGCSASTVRRQAAPAPAQLRARAAPAHRRRGDAAQRGQGGETRGALPTISDCARGWARS